MARPIVKIVPADQIKAFDQVRTERDEKADASLLASIKRFGILQPISLVAIDGGYRVQSGHRRFEMGLHAGLNEFPALILDEHNLGDTRAAQLIENIEREAMTLKDISAAVRAVYDEADAPKSQTTADILSRSKGWVSKMLMISAPTTNTQVARRIIAADKVSDLEMAYLLCQIEAANPLEALDAEKNIDTETRASLKKRLTRAKKHAAGEVDPSGGDAERQPGDDEGEIVRPEWTPDLLMFARALVIDAAVKPADLERKTQVMALLEAEQVYLDAE